MRLSQEGRRYFDRATWQGRSRTFRTWLYWVAGINVSLIAIDWVLEPDLLNVSMLLRGFGLTALYLVLAFMWRKPRPAWQEGISVVVAGTGVLTIAAVLGYLGGGVMNERYLTCGMLVIAVLIVVARVRMVWIAWTYVLCVLLGLCAFLMNPMLGVVPAFALTGYYALALGALVVARRSVLMVEQRSFLMRLRDDFRVEALLTLATTDPLTGCFNRRHFTTALHELWTDARSSKAWFSIILVDIDHFKRINDTLGHAAGDRCLAAIAMAIQANVRDGRDVVARFGGEEFIVAAPDVDAEGAVTIGERIRAGVEALALPEFGIGPGHPLTVSVGVAATKPAADPSSSEKVIERADTALYAAKNNGRNRVECDLTEAAEALRLIGRRQDAATPPSDRLTDGRTRLYPRT